MKQFRRKWNRTLLRHSASKIFGMLLRGFFIGLRTGAYPVFVGSHTRITGKKFLNIGPWAKIEDLAEINCVSHRGVTLCSYSSVGRGVKIMPSGYYSGEMGEGLRLGSNSAIGPDSYIGASGFVDIGDNVITGPSVKILAQNHVFTDPDVPIREQDVTQRGIVIEHDCWIGANVIILDGVHIGAHSVLAAGAVVTGDVSEGSVVAGVPAKRIAWRKGFPPAGS